MPAVRLDIATTGRHFVHAALAIEYAHGAELAANGHGAPKQALDLLRRRGRRKVPIEMRPSEQCIAHGTPDAPRLETGLLERGRELTHGVRRIQHAHCP